MTCIHCTEEIMTTDRTHKYSGGPLVHRECFLRQIFGSVSHQAKMCSCFVPGSSCGDPEGMSKREAARMAVKMFYQGRDKS